MKRIADSQSGFRPCTARLISIALQRAQLALLTISALLCTAGAAEAQGNDPVPRSPIELTIQTGHTAEIHGLEYAPNGKFFVSAGKDSTIKLWSPAGTLIRTIRTGFWVDHLAISRDSQLLLAASRAEGNILLLSFDGRVVHRFPNLQFISSVALSDDNRMVAIGTIKGLVLYRLEGTVETQLQAEGDSSKTEAKGALFPDEVDCLLFTHEGGIVGGYADGKLRFWTEEGKLIRTVVAHDYAIKALALSPDGKTLATAGMPYLFPDVAKNIKALTKLWDLEGNALGQFPSHFTQSLRFTPDGMQIVSGGRFDHHINFYSKTGGLSNSITTPSGVLQSPCLIALSPDGKTVLSADDNFNPPGLGMWNVDGRFEHSFYGLSGPITNVAVSPDGAMIVTLSADRLVRIWSISGRLIASLPGHTEYPTGLAYAPNGIYFASSGSELIIWSRFGEKIAEEKGFRKGARVLAISPDSRFLFCGDGEGIVHVYDFKEKTAHHFKASDGPVSALAIHPSGNFLATGGYREEVRIWDLDGKLQGESRFEGKSTHFISPTYSLAFSPDGSSLVATNSNPEMSLQILDLKAQHVGTLKVPNAYPGPTVAFSKSGKWLAAAANNTVCVWDWPTRKLMRVFKGHIDTVDGLSFMPDEEHLVSAGRDATTRIWRLDNGYSMALLSHGSDWINYTPDGYFDASHYGGGLISITRGFDTFGIDQFALQLNRPDIILSRMGIGSAEFIEHLRTRYQRRLEHSGFHQDAPGFSLEAPDVRLLNTKQDGKFVQIEAQINDLHYLLKSYQIYVNNVPIFSGQGKPITGLRVRVSDRIELGQGDNKIEISALNSQGVEALRARWSAFYRPDSKDGKSDLYYIGFGISHYQNPALNLQFAHKDVLDLGAALQRYTGSFRRVIAKTYVDNAVTPDNILQAKELLKNAGVDDTVIILVSGHGAYDLSKEATYYYGTYDLDARNIATTAVSFDQIESLLGDITPRRKLLLLDTCESGEMDEATRAELTAKMQSAGLSARTSPLFQQTRAGQPKRVFLYERDRYIYNDLERRTGSIIFSSSHAGEMSFESPKIQNGFFTHEILEALGSSQADTNHDGRISVDELEAFVTLRVALQTGGLQRPTVDRDNIDQQFSFPLLH